jgi:hypothetical protein
MMTQPSLFPQLRRREFLRVGLASFAGYHLLPTVAPLRVQARAKAKPRGSADFCIFLFLMGGPPQLDTFDVKEGKWTPPDFDIRTVRPGIRMPFGLFPGLSGKLDHLVLARSVEAWESVHERGQYYVQVGRAFSAARAGEMPSVGSVVAYEFAGRRQAADFLPPFVGMNFPPDGAGLAGPGMLPATFGPLPLTVTANADLGFVVPEPERARFRRRWEFLQRLDESLRSGKEPLGRPLRDYHDYYAGAFEMMKRPESARVLSIPDADHKRYGSSGLGDACVVARNLVAADAGTRFIAVAHNGWDLHANVYAGHYKLCKELDAAFTSLLDDLAKTRDGAGRTLLERTLIVCMGEFGRTPGELNANKGRDHYRYASTTVFAGGGVRGGRALGATDATGAKVVEPGWHKKRSIFTEDIVATIYSALGIDWTKKITNTPSGRAFYYVEKSSATDYVSPTEVTELFA